MVSSYDSLTIYGSTRKVLVAASVCGGFVLIGVVLVMMPAPQRGILSTVSPTVVNILVGGVGLVGLLGALGLAPVATRIHRRQPLLWIEGDHVHVCTFWRELKTPVADIRRIESSHGIVPFMTIWTHHGALGALPVFDRRIHDVEETLRSASRSR